MPITESKVRDARPALNAKAVSEKKLFSADISKGTVNVKRGEGRQITLALKYEEVTELKALLADIEEHLSKNQYEPDKSLDEGYEAGTARYTAPSRAAATAADPTTANETAQAEGTTPAEQPAATTADAPAADEDNPFGA